MYVNKTLEHDLTPLQWSTVKASPAPAPYPVSPHQLYSPLAHWAQATLALLMLPEQAKLSAPSGSLSLILPPLPPGYPQANSLTLSRSLLKFTLVVKTFFDYSI